MHHAVKDKRKLRNALVDRAAQFRLLRPFAVMLTLQIVYAMLLNLSLRTGLDGLADESNPALLARLHALTLNLTTLTAIWLAVTGLLTILFWIRSTHRLLGPAVALNRQLRAMLEGRFGARVRLRKHDEFMEVAGNLNALAESLDRKDA